ncbi:MAG: hypothetical protein QG568_413 [Patescibacteria group bacterium]|nr:hypothetical protein [Patescibacteria group bacterium]
MKPDKNNIGNAGEYYVASKLSAMDCIVTVTLGRAEAFDLLIVTKNGKGSHYKVSVKTAWSATAGSFVLNEKAELINSPDLFYAFVKINENVSSPEVWVIPSSFVASVVKKSHQNYIESGHNQNSLRGFPIAKPRGSYDKYYDFVDFNKIDKYKGNYSVFE